MGEALVQWVTCCELITAPQEAIYSATSTEEMQILDSWSCQYYQGVFRLVCWSCWQHKITCSAPISCLYLAQHGSLKMIRSKDLDGGTSRTVEHSSQMEQEGGLRPHVSQAGGKLGKGETDGVESNLASAYSCL